MHALRILPQNEKNTATLTSKLIFDQLSSACLHIINLQDSFHSVRAVILWGLHHPKNSVGNEINEMKLHSLGMIQSLYNLSLSISCSLPEIASQNPSTLHRCSIKSPTWGAPHYICSENINSEIRSALIILACQDQKFWYIA